MDDMLYASHIHTFGEAICRFPYVILVFCWKLRRPQCKISKTTCYGYTLKMIANDIFQKAFLIFIFQKGVLKNVCTSYISHLNIVQKWPLFLLKNFTAAENKQHRKMLQKQMF